MKKAILPFIMFMSLGLVNITSSNDLVVANAQSISTIEENNTNQFEYMNVGDTLNTYTGKGVKIAVIDIGINTTHEDFYDSEGKCIISNKSAYFSSSDSSSLKKPHTMNFGMTNGRNDVSSYEDLLNGLKDYSGGHGTHVASMISSQINGVGSVGIAPDAELIFIKCANEKGVFPSRNWINGAIEYAIEVGADIINLSIQSYAVNDIKYGSSTSGTGYIDAPTAYESSIKKAWDNGIIIVSAAGNYNTNYASYPANNDNVICVGALANESLDTKATYSNYGNGGTKADANGKQVACGDIDLVAPGGGYGANAKSNSSYSDSSWGGTSFASPLVAGAIALYKEAYPNASQSDIIKALYESCFDLNNEEYFGNGRLDVKKFLSTSVDSLVDNAVNAIDSFINAFKEKREDPSDLTNITDAYDIASDLFDKLSNEEQQLVSNSKYLDAGLNAFMFLDDFYYKEVRLKDKNDEWSICEFIANKDNAETFKENCDMYIDDLTNEILSFTYDIPTSDGGYITINESLNYILMAFNSNLIETNDNSNTNVNLEVATFPTILIGIFGLIMLVILLLYVRKGKKS